MANKKLTDSFGSARWANDDDLLKEDILTFPLESQKSLGDNEYKSFLLGEKARQSDLLSSIKDSYEQSMFWMFKKSIFDDSKRKNYLAWHGDGHIISIAPTRTGKGVGLVIPNLLNYPGSVIVTDPKGENYAITSNYRERNLNQQIVKLDPFHSVNDEETDSINPLEGMVNYKLPVSDYLKDNPCLIDEILSLSDSMIIRPPDEKDPHWNDKARTMLKCIIMAIICGLAPSRRRHLAEVRSILLSVDFVGFIKSLGANRIPLGGMLSQAAIEVLSMGQNEFASVRSSLSKQTEFLDSPQVQKSLGDMNDLRGASGTYNLRDLKIEGAVSIYMIIPPAYLSTYSRLLRIWITQAMNAMTRTYRKPADGCSVLFLLDEIAQLGTLECLRQAVSLLAGYGMSVWMIWQDLSQLKLLYKEDWASFLANAKIQQFFGINDLDSAKYVSEMLGKSTIALITEAITKGKSGKWTEFVATSSSNATATYAEKERELLSPDEIRRLNRESILMFVQGSPPILAKRITYFKDENFTSRSSTNPFLSI